MNKTTETMKIMTENHITMKTICREMPAFTAADVVFDQDTQNFVKAVFEDFEQTAPNDSALNDRTPSNVPSTHWAARLMKELA